MSKQKNSLLTEVYDRMFKILLLGDLSMLKHVDLSNSF